jgi:murein DD-endopeptidase MepM/ murein hydrolase activator NlpD
MGYGREMTVNGDENKKIVNNGVDFTVAAGTAVPAVAAGKVVYVGTTAFTGNLVVVDHGYGLMSWYWNMASVSVAKDDMIEKNDTVGTVGSTGFFYGKGSGIEVMSKVGAGTSVTLRLVGVAPVRDIAPPDEWDEQE